MSLFVTQVEALHRGRGQPTLRARWKHEYGGRPEDIRGLAADEHVTRLREALMPLVERFNRIWVATRSTRSGGSGRRRVRGSSGRGRWRSGWRVRRQSEVEGRIWTPGLPPLEVKTERRTLAPSRAGLHPFRTIGRIHRRQEVAPLFVAWTNISVSGTKDASVRHFEAPRP
jgi:hypothetical protein